MEKIGRNDPCWCRSGKKYKKCHLNKENEKRPEIWEVDASLRKIHGKKHCSCPTEMKHECNGNIINAHTVSKSASLKTISENGHVYGHKVSINKIHHNNGHLKYELIGINKASTFTGFCAYHDKNLFSVFEDQPFIETPEQVFLLSYRTIARENFNKLAHSETRTLLESGDAGFGVLEQELFRAFLNRHNHSLDLGVRDSNYHKQKFDDTLKSKEFENIEFCSIKFDGLLPFQCSGSHYPTTALNGTKLQALDSQETLDNMCISIINDPDKSFILLSWLKDSRGSCIEFVKVLLSMDYGELKSEITNYIFSHFENIYLKPSWWDTLEHNSKKFLETANQPLHIYHPIETDTLEFHEHNIIEISKNFQE